MRVSARVYDVKGGAILSKNNFFGTTHGDAWTPRLRSPSLIMAPGGISKGGGEGRRSSTFSVGVSLVKTFVEFHFSFSLKDGAY